MKALLILSALSCAFGATISKRQSPDNFTIVPIGNRGNGCPDHSLDYRTSVVEHMWAQLTEYEDRPTLWRYALGLPLMMGATNFKTDTYDDSYRWCEHEWQVNAPGWRINADVNGTEILARYVLDEGISANWKMTYYLPGGGEHVDTFKVDGPISVPTRHHYEASYPAERQLTAPPENPWKTGCGEGDNVVRMKTEVDIEGEGIEGHNVGLVYGDDERDFYNRIYQVLSFTWEECE